MQKAKLLHNPGAGAKAYTKQQLIELVESYGIHCSYSSTKSSGWKNLDSSIDFIVAAGGDGTVRKIATWLLNRKRLQKQPPVALFPQGTANNIAKTLSISGADEQIVQSWVNGAATAVDVGLVEGLEAPNFFLESFGYGLVPYLMEYMSKDANAIQATPEKELQHIRAEFQQLIATYKARTCQLSIDGVDYSDNYLLVEIMNIRSIGPNLFLAPAASPTDGWLDVVLVKESQRNEFATYVHKKKWDAPCSDSIVRVKAKTIEIGWEGTQAHIDDELIELSKAQPVRIQIQPGLIEFLAINP